MISEYYDRMIEMERLAREVRTRNACASARGWQSRVGAAAR